MTGIRTYEGKKIEKGSAAKVADPLTVEQALEIDINGESFTVVMQTPGDEIELAIGLLYAEDVIKSTTPFTYETFQNELGQIERIDLKILPEHIGEGYMSSRSLLSVSSCGICGKRSLEDLQIQEGQLPEDTLHLTTQQLFAMQTEMIKGQENFKTTGGCHGIAIFSKEGTLLTLKEDIGRHNAMDKAVGALINENKLKEAHIVLFSGRVSYEIISKVFRAKVPIIMAVSAPSSLAVDFSKEYGITLLAFSRNGKTTCYANCHRVKID